ncbi:helix-turn-helix transcriptional regulator [Paenibacillus beijingensis]|uniref:AraC family transcriptional regulator n=1 Tax=Paenibacillus beijingensis TaxID=1126833 RepID=A0A0D5NJD9_9BACL|nr:AraC family transcriptional regulator [Paenibacillus beijingensis]AJY75210.1 AraC family transcriptional regulator [Paenibacillus beijingensis]
MELLQFTVPPLPHYISSGLGLDPPGSKHVNRRGIGVFDLLMVQEGCLYVGEEDRRYEVSAGYSLILRPDCHHFGIEPCRETTRYYWLHFHTAGLWNTTDKKVTPPGRSREKAVDPDAYKFFAESFSVQLPQFALMAQPAKIFDLAERLTALYESGALGGAMWKQQLLFQELLMLLSASIDTSGSQPAAACAELAAAYLRRNFRDDITIRAMADSLNFHPVYIARCMQKEFGCSPVEYLLRYRIEQAKLLLLRTDYSISRIAGEVGFNQAAYFASCFTKYEGLSPRSYRQRFSHG